METEKTKSEKMRERMERAWKDPAYREKMIAKQRSLGYRTYDRSTKREGELGDRKPLRYPEDPYMQWLVNNGLL